MVVGAKYLTGPGCTSEPRKTSWPWGMSLPHPPGLSFPHSPFDLFSSTNSSRWHHCSQHIRALFSAPCGVKDQKGTCQNLDSQRVFCSFPYVCRGAPGHFVFFCCKAEVMRKACGMVNVSSRSSRTHWGLSVSKCQSAGRRLFTAPALVKQSRETLISVSISHVVWQEL